jgi:tRNA (mo5U34)-methyltransferase
MMDKVEIQKRIDELKPFFHYFNLDGIETKPEGMGYREGRFYPKDLFSAFCNHLPELTGQRCIDIGCNNGFFSFELAKRGAIVKGIDNNQNNTGMIEKALFIKEVLGLDVEFVVEDFMDEKDEAVYDLILFLGVYYHLPKPEMAIPKLSKIIKPGGLLFLESAIGNNTRYGDTGNIYDGDKTNYLIPSAELLNKELEESGFKIEERLPYHRYFIKAVKC